MIESALKNSISNDHIAITGLGLVSCLGLSVADTWEGICQGKDGFGPMSAMESVLPPEATGGQADDLPEDFASELPREIRYLRWAIIAALKDAELKENSPYDPGRCAVMLGTTLHGIRAGGRYLRDDDAMQLGSFSAGAIVRQATRGLNLNGFSETTCSACSSSLAAVALASDLLLSNQADMVVAGGYDAISEYGWGGFNSLRLVTDGVPLPFSKSRAGMKLAEGYGIVVLERSSEAKQRKVKPTALVGGWGQTSDAYHLTRPEPGGQGASQAINQAIDSAGIAPENIDLISAHATATPGNDAAEFAALDHAFGDHLPQCPVVAFKSHLGHTLGGAGAVELVLCACALSEQMIPGCANVTKQEVEFDKLNLSVGQAQPGKLDYTLNLSMGFGGANTAVVLKKPEEAPAPVKSGNVAPPKGEKEIWITGIGVMLPGVIGNQPFSDYIRQQSPQILSNELKESQYAHLLNQRLVRRMSPYVKQTLAVAQLGWEDSGLLKAQSGEQNDCTALCDAAAILATTHGSIHYCLDYYQKIVQQGVGAANPMLFAEGVPNAAAAQLSLIFKMNGFCQTLIGSSAAGMDSLHLAAQRIKLGFEKPMMVAAVEEAHPKLNQIYSACAKGNAKTSNELFTDDTEFTLRPAAVALILEEAGGAKARGARPYGVLMDSHVLNEAPDRLPATLKTVLDALDSADNILLPGGQSKIDRVQEATVTRLKPEMKMTSLQGRFDNTFSAGPLLSVAAGLMTAGQSGAPLVSLHSDWSGAVAGAALKPLAGRVIK